MIRIRPHDLPGRRDERPGPFTSSRVPAAPAQETTVAANHFDRATAALDPPLAAVDLDAFEANAAELSRRAGGRPIRVATKSVRCRELLRRVLALPGFSGLMCYSLREAQWLCHAGLSDDLLVAYPTVDREALRALAADRYLCRRITLMIDSGEHLDVIDAALGTDTPAREDIRVCLEIDASWRPVASEGVHVGTRRSPVHSVRQAAGLADEVLSRPGFHLAGVMAYEGQIAGVPDDPGGRLRGLAVRWVQRRSAAELARRRAAAVSAVVQRTPLEFVNGGGTGSLERTSSETVVTEVAAGSGLIGPTLFDSYRGFRPRPAVLFALPVVHRPARNIVTLYGGGYVASGPAASNRLPSPHLPPGLRLTGAEGAGEVQTPVRGRAARALRLGDRVWLRHAKAGELAERFETYHLVRGDHLVDTAPTYRGEGRTFG